MISEFGKLRSWALLISILVCGPLFHLLFFESNVNLRRISYDISASPNSKFKGERDSEQGEQRYAIQERFEQIQDIFVKSDIMDTPRGPDGFEASRDEESLKAFKAWQEEQAEFKAWQEEQMQRRSLVDEACATKTRKGAGKKKGSPKILHHQRVFTYNKKHNLLYCLQPKVASTTWLKHFISLENATQQDILEKARRDGQKKILSPKDPDIVSLAKASVSFSMVRHPFERLVSAYLDKVVLVAGKLIAERGNASFPSFVRWLTSKVHKDVCFKNGESRDCAMNPHWLPLQARCFYCMVPYKIIAKFETFSEDLRYIGQLANVTFKEDVQENPTKNLRKTLVKISVKKVPKRSLEEQEEATERALSYFNQLTRSEVDSLYRFYKEDFLMFGYSPKHFFNAAKPD